MKVTIEQTPKVPKHPYFIVKNRLSCVNDFGIGRILWCPNPGLTILFKKGNGDERLAASIGDEVAFDTTYYTVIDKLILETEYVNQ